MLNQSLTEVQAAHNNIDLLFSQAQNLEAQSKIEDAYLTQLRANKFRQVSIIGQLGPQVRAQMHKLMFTSKSDVSTLYLRFMYTLVCIHLLYG